MKKLVHEIHRRSLWQVLGIYLVASWLVLQVVDTLSGALRLPDWASPMALVLLIVGLPIVLATAFVQVGSSAEGDEEEAAGETASAERTSRAPAGFAASHLLTWRNAITGGVGAFLLLFGFAGLYVVIQDRGRSFNPLNEDALGAATTTVTVEDTAGNMIEREIPRDEFRRSVALFAFDNETGDTAANWLRFGIPEAIEVDLYQDVFTRFVSVDDDQINRDLREAGFEDGAGAPLPLKRKLAQDRHLDALLTGSIVRTDSGLVVETELYDATRGRLIERHTMSGADVFELGDQMSVQLKRDLGIPELQIEESEDLPVSELATASESAFRQYVLGARRSVGGDYAGAAERLSAATGEDPSFALAYATLVGVYLSSNQAKNAAAAMQTVKRHLYRLPERLQLSLRTLDYAYIEGDPEQALKTAQYWTELYPQDMQGREILATLYNFRGEWDARISELEAILSIEPNRYAVMRQIGDAYERQARYDSALSWYGRYAEFFPNDYQSSLDIGDLHARMGAHDQARAAFERARLVEPGEVEVLTRLLRLETNLGDFEAAQEWADEALAASRGPEDRADVYQAADDLYCRQGRIGAAIDNYRQLVGALGETGSSLAGLGASRQLALWSAHEVGRVEWAYGQLDSLRAAIAPPFDVIVGVYYARALAAAGDVGQARVELERAATGIESGGFQVLKPVVAWVEGRIHENEGDCRSAVESYRQALTLRPGDSTTPADLGRCQREIGELEAAETTLLDVLKIVPADAKARVELARVYEETGRQADASEQLEAAVSIWKDSDPDYIPAQEARATLGEVLAER